MGSYRVCFFYISFFINSIIIHSPQVYPVHRIAVAICIGAYIWIVSFFGIGTMPYTEPRVIVACPRSTGDGSEMIRFIFCNSFIISSFPYSYIVVDFDFLLLLSICISLANIEDYFHPAKRITIYFGLSFDAN